MPHDNDIAIYVHQYLVSTIRTLSEDFKISKEHAVVMLFGTVVGLLLRDNTPEAVREGFEQIVKGLEEPIDNNAALS